MANFALFVDFENILYEVAKRDELIGTETPDGAPSAEASDLTLQLLVRLVARFERGGEHSVLVRRAYADWEGLGATGNQTALQLMSVKPEPVLAKPGKNSADLELSLDALEVLLTRADIDGIIVVSGDRDYIPIVRRLKERGKQVYVVGMGQASSGDLRAIVGPRNFLHGENFLRPSRYADDRSSGSGDRSSETPRPAYEPLRPGHYGTREDSLTLAPLTGDEAAEDGETDERQPDGLTNTGSFRDRNREARMDEFDDERQPEELALSEDELRQHLNDYNVRKCIRLVHEAVGQHSNHIYLVPFFRNYMNLKFTYLANDQRKELLKKLQQDGVIQMEWTPTSQPNGGYTSFSLNYDHPLVRETLGPDAAPPSGRPRSSAPSRDTGARYADPRTAYGSAY